MCKHIKMCGRVSVLTRDCQRTGGHAEPKGTAAVARARGATEERTGSGGGASGSKARGSGSGGEASGSKAREEHIVDVRK